MVGFWIIKTNFFSLSTLNLKLVLGIGPGRDGPRLVMGRNLYTLNGFV